MRIRNNLFQIKIKIWQNVNFVDDKCVADLKNKRVFQRLVMPLRHGKDHGVLYRARIKFRGAHKISHIFKDGNIHILDSHASQSLPGHVGVKVTHAAGVELNRPDPRIRNAEPPS